MKRFIVFLMTLCLILGTSSISVWATSTSQGATNKAIIGDTLANPESGWKRIDSGKEFWNCLTKTGHWTNPEGWLSYDPSAGYWFKFTGDKIRFLYRLDQYTSPVLHVKVDGVDYYSQKFTKYTSVPYLAIEILNLGSGEHKVEVIGAYVDSNHHISVHPIDIPAEGNILEKSSIKLSVLLNTGETVQLSTSFDLDNNKNYTWSSTNEAVATVDANGKITAITEGTADIYAQNTDGTFKEYIPVKVVKGIADELRLAAHLKIGEKAKLYLTDDASKVTWTSMDESIATVAADGQVTGVKKGLAIVKAELDGQSYQIYVRVNG